MTLSTFNKIEMWFWRIWKVVAFILSIIFLFFLILQIGNYKYQLLKIITITEKEEQKTCSVDKIDEGTQFSFKGQDYIVNDAGFYGGLGKIVIYFDEVISDDEKSKEEIRLINLKNCGELPKPHPFEECVKEVNDNSGLY